VLVRFGALLAALCAVGAANAAAPSSPCKLATAAQVKAAFGGTVGAGKVDSSLPSAPTCHFSVKNSNLGVAGEAVVFITPGQSAATFKLAKKYVPGAVTVTGVGAAAFYNPHTTSIELLKGNTVASAQGIFFGANAAKVKADVIALAKAVAKRL
jgi:type IV secretory pathway protease TraF